MEKFRGFKLISCEHRKFKNKEIQLPLRGSKESAGYDFYSNENISLPPQSKHIFWTDIKAYMREGEVLKIYIRSSIGLKKGLVLANSVAIIDKDYFENPNNDGNIGVCLYNSGEYTEEIKDGERIAQGIFEIFLTSDNCNSEEERKGGIGSTNQ
jgi:dUTP pyrophosphatase